MPSFASSDEIARPNACRSISTPVRSVLSNAASTASFASRSATGLFLRDLGGDALRLLEPGLLRHDARDEPERERLLGAEEAAGEDHVHRHRLADRPRQALRAAGAGDEAELDLRLAELRRLRGDDHVAEHRQLAAAAEAVAGDRRDDRRPDLPDRVPALQARRSDGVDRARRGQLADVGAGREGALAAAEDDAAHRLVGVQLLERGDDLAHQLVGERVQRLGAVHQDDADRAVPLDDDELLVAHFSLPRKRLTASCASVESIESASQSRAWLTVWCQARSRQKLSCCFA